MTANTDHSIPALLSTAIGQLATLITNEIDLAKAEMSRKAVQAGRSVALIGVGAAIMMPAIVVLLFAIASALQHAGLSEGIAYLATGGVAALVAGVLIKVGLSQMSPDALKPSITIDQISSDKSAVREMIR